MRSSTRSFSRLKALSSDFVSPENTLKQRELFYFNKYMNQRCGELEKTVREIIEKSKDDLKNKLQRDLVEALQLEMKYNYDQFKKKQ